MITLTVFSILASLAILEDWYAELRTDWPADPPHQALIMAGMVLAGFWVAAMVTAWIVGFIFEVVT